MLCRIFTTAVWILRHLTSACATGCGSLLRITLDFEVFGSCTQTGLSVLNAVVCVSDESVAALSQFLCYCQFNAMATAQFA